MSNNKQSSVDFIVNLLIEKGYAGVLNEDEKEETKAMHRKEIVTAHSTALPIEDGVFTAIDKGHKYYNETFGGNK